MMNKEWQAKPIPQEIKAAAAGDLMAGLEPIEIATKYDISLASVSRIKKKYLSAEMLAKMEEEQAAQLGELMVLSLESSVEATMRIANKTRDEGWLTAQNAGDLGKMYGIISDKVARTMQALEASHPSETQEIGGLDN